MNCKTLIPLLLLLTSAQVRGAEPSEETWRNITQQVGGERWGYAGVTYVTAAPDGSSLLAGVSAAGLWRSTDTGGTWKRLGAAGPEAGSIGHRTYSIRFDPRDAKRFWVSGNYGPGLFETRDDGQTFRRLGNLQHLDLVAIDFTDPERKTFLAGQHEQARSLMRSKDGGVTWDCLGLALPEQTNFSTDPLVLDGQTYLINCAGWKRGLAWGLYRTADGGSSWTKVASEGPFGPALVHPDGTLYWAITWTYGMLKSTDRGLTWKKLPGPVTSPPQALPDGTLGSLGDERLYISKDGAQSWQPLGPKLPYKKMTGWTYLSASKTFVVWRMSGKRVEDAIFAWTADAP
ncbi:MAG: hypothetical protein HS116_09235 [Planctomycetes bacterium]|nr:hypothetical protein [Planctomycetota bacterium]